MTRSSEAPRLDAARRDPISQPTPSPAAARVASQRESSMTLRRDLLGSERRFQGHYLKVDVRRYQGLDCEHVREIAVVPDGVAVLAILPDGRVPLVRQFRQAIDQVIFEIPAGIREPDEEPAETARRECIEETGVVARELVHLIRYAHAEGYSSGMLDVFFAPITEIGVARPDPGEELELVLVPLAEFYRMLDEGEFLDAKTLLAGHLARPHLARHGWTGF